MGNDELPLPGYDQLPLGDLRHRVRSLTEEQLRLVPDHERRHGNRQPVLEVLTARLDELVDGAEPSGGDPASTPRVTGTPGVQPVAPGHPPEDNTPLRHGVAGQTPARGRD